jgi:methylated-DNA-[protein]-cysteine S-methyltransferase
MHSSLARTTTGILPVDKDAQHYLIFETAMGFCGIGWNDVGITCFRLPTPREAATRHQLLRRLPNAKPARPGGQIAEAVDLAKLYFAGEEADFRRFTIDLGTQNPFFRQVYDAVRALVWGRT